MSDRPTGHDLDLPVSLNGKRTPFEIHGWQHTQLSVARFYGGIKYNGAQYKIDKQADGQPLVRWDLVKARAKLKRKGKPSKGKPKQGDLLEAAE